MDAEVSWDLEMSDDMPFIEGCFRLADGPWQIVTAFKRPEINEVETRTDLIWDSGVGGINVLFPDIFKLNSQTLLNEMSRVFDIDYWTETRGPDSMTLR